MGSRYAAIWFRYLATDYCTLRQPALAQVPFVLAAPQHGRMVVRAINPLAHAAGIEEGIALADARAIVPSLQVLDDQPALTAPLLQRLAIWCIRFTPVAAPDLPDGLLLDTSGCAHLWGGEKEYLAALVTRLQELGFTIRAALADTIGAAWGLARFGAHLAISDSGMASESLLSLPPEALRLETNVSERLHQLGLHRIHQLLPMPRRVLQRRFGAAFIHRLDQALGHAPEILEPVQAPAPYEERLPCLEPIVSANGIATALQWLLDKLCERLAKEGKGIRQVCLKAFRVDGQIEQIGIGTNRVSLHAAHLFRLLQEKIAGMEPALGIELFVLTATQVEPMIPLQEKLWEGNSGLEDTGLSELVDRLSLRIDHRRIRRYVPVAQYWPENSYRLAANLHIKNAAPWPLHQRRPVQVLTRPAPIQVTAPIPDYPPLLFRYQGKVHTIKKADGPERIGQPWWLHNGEHRDYYIVEDEAGSRYWLFRLGHYDEKSKSQWFLHGFFA